MMLLNSYYNSLLFSIILLLNLITFSRAEGLPSVSNYLDQSGVVTIEQLRVSEYPYDGTVEFDIILRDNLEGKPRETRGFSKTNPGFPLSRIHQQGEIVDEAATNPDPSKPTFVFQIDDYISDPAFTITLWQPETPDRRAVVRIASDEMRCRFVYGGQRKRSQTRIDCTWTVNRTNTKRNLLFG